MFSWPAAPFRPPSLMRHRCPSWTRRNPAIWLLNGDRLVALTEHSARIETKSGATLTYYRKPGKLGRSLAWELDLMSQRPILTRNTENE